MKPQHPQAQDPARPTAATDPQQAEIAGNVFEGLKTALSSSEEDREKLKEDLPLEDTPQTKPAE